MDDHADPAKANRYRAIAIAFLLLLALFSSLGSFVVWFAGAIAGYFGFLAFYYSPRSIFFNQFLSTEKSTRPDYASSEDIQQKARKTFQIGTAALIVIFIILFIIGSRDESDDKNNTKGVASGQADEENAVLLKSDPGNIDALTAVGNKFYSDNLFDSAMAYYNRILAIEPRNPVALYNKGLVYYDQKEYLESIEILRTCLQIDPSNKDAAYVMGHNYYDQEQYDEAFTWYSKAYAAGLRDAFLSHALGYLYDEKKQNASRAIELYKEALSMDSSRVTIYTRLAELEPEKAVFYKRKAKEWTK
jgi:tetratricopeptide (TPR) repeat protein